MQSKQDPSVFYSIDVMSWYVMHMFVYTFISKYTIYIYMYDMVLLNPHQFFSSLHEIPSL